MFADGRLAAQTAVDPTRVVGRYTLYDDGWRCGLDLRLRPGSDALDATFFSYDRTAGWYPATASLEPRSGALTLLVSNFNELAEQQYVGFVSRQGAVTICGTTHWQQYEFGFYAARCAPHAIGDDTLLQPTLPDLLGTFLLHAEGTTCRLEITDVDGAGTTGTLQERTGETRAVALRPDESDQRRFSISVPGEAGSSPTIAAWMFSRRHDALAGWIDWDGHRSGCYLSRIASQGVAP